ncbi:MAG TPA: hypothetical protein VLI54_01190 [Bacillota bacterium]|nr:hypothetical protein [Bacillota bacterium]
MSLLKALTTSSAQRQAEKRARKYRELIRREANIGGRIFGPVAKDGRREFFCLDERTWVWHEEWVDAAGRRHAVTTRYDVRPNGIFKAQDGHPYQPLTRDEAIRLKKAVLMYNDMVEDEIYNRI